MPLASFVMFIMSSSLSCNSAFYLVHISTANPYENHMCGFHKGMHLSMFSPRGGVGRGFDMYFFPLGSAFHDIRHNTSSWGWGYLTRSSKSLELTCVWQRTSQSNQSFFPMQIPTLQFDLQLPLNLKFSNCNLKILSCHPTNNVA